MSVLVTDLKNSHVKKRTEVLYSRKQCLHKIESVVRYSNTNGLYSDNKGRKCHKHQESMLVFETL